MAERELNIVIKVLAEGAQAGFSALTRTIGVLRRTLLGLGSILKGILNQFFSLKGLIAGVGMAALGKSFIDAASSAENYRLRLVVLLGSMKEANRLFKDMTALSSKVPATYDEIMQSATALAGVMKGGVDEINKWMPLILDLQAVSGLTLQETTSNFIKMFSAGAAAADMFRERGVLAMLGFKAGVTYSVEETRKKLWEAWESPISKFRNATLLLTTTWDGLMSNLGDAWFQFRTAVMDAGLFDFLKAGIKVIIDEVDRLRKEGKLEAWAKSISDGVISAIKWVITAIGDFVDAVRWAVGQAVESFVTLKSTIIDVMSVIPGTAASAIAEYRRLRKELENVSADWKRIQEAQQPGMPEIGYIGYDIVGETKRIVERMQELRASTHGVMLESSAAEDALLKMAEALKSEKVGAEAAKSILTTLNEKIAEMNKVVDDFVAAQNRQRDAMDGVTNAAQAQADAIEDLNKRRMKNEEEWGKALQDRSDQVRDQASEYADMNKRRMETEEEWGKALQDSVDKEAKAEKDKADTASRGWVEMQQVGTEALRDSIDIFAELYRQSGEKQKKYLYAWKAMKIAEATIATITASINALEAGTKIGGPFGVAIGTGMAGIVAALGGAKIGLIASQNFAGGGFVDKGTSPTADDVPIMASKGEYMQPASAVSYYGVEAMEAVRRRMVPRGLLADFARPSVRGFAMGGLVGDDASPAGGRGGALNVVNVYDQNQLGSYLASRPGETVLLNVIRKNAHSLWGPLR